MYHPMGFLTKLFQCYVGPDNSWMNFVGRQERLVDDLVQALTLAGETIDEDALRNGPSRNATPPEFKDRAIVSDELAILVEQAEHWVLETFYV